MDTSNAGEQPVEKAPEVIPEASQETVTLTKAEADALITAAEEANALAQQKAEEAENYKKGMLKAKGKLKDVYGDDENEEAPMTKADIVATVAEAVKMAIPQYIKPEQTELDKANLKLEEMRNVIKSRTQLAPSSAGSNQDKPGAAENSKYSSANYWSPAQIADLEKKGLNPDTVYKNMGVPGAPGNPLPPPNA